MPTDGCAPRWVTTDNEIIKAYIELVDKVCPCAILVHSQSGTFGHKVRIDSARIVMLQRNAADRGATLQGYL